MASKLSLSVEHPDLVAASRKKGFYQPELDCLRFLGFLGIFSYHCFPTNDPNHWSPEFYAGWPHTVVSVIGATVRGGVLGVPAFFVLSAYLITSLLLRERERTGTLDTRDFYVRRILRIWPVYFVFLAFASVLPFFAKSQHLPFVYIAGYSLMAGNWVHVFLGAPVSVAAPLWTMSVEEQFYLVWPLVLRKASHASIAKIAIALVIAGNLSRVLLVHAHASSDAITYNTVSCVDPLALGVLIALVFKERPPLTSLQRFGLLLCCIATVIGGMAFVDIDRGRGLVVGRCLGMFASAGIVISFLGTTNYLVRNPIVRYLGKISYGLYVLHLFGWLCAFRVLGISRTHMQTMGEAVKVAALGLVLTILFASISYRYLERPFLRLKERFTHVRSRPV